MNQGIIKPLTINGVEYCKYSIEAGGMIYMQPTREIIPGNRQGSIDFYTVIITHVERIELKKLVLKN